MDDVMHQRASVGDYAALVAQHYFVYVALEEAARQLAADPRFAVFHPEALVRLPALEADLAHLLGPEWRNRIQAVPATEDYAARISEIGAEGWLPGIVAHHYTRYLGDLSGGQMIARAVSQQHGFDGEGVAFYDFTDLGAIPTFKADYRDALDALGESLDEAEKQRVIDEVRAAYAFNTRTFLDLDRARAAAPSA
jgi:heme oxygenase